VYLYYIMSWQSLSATNDTHRNSKLSAKKVIVKNIVVSQETTMGSMDVSNLEYTRDDYSGNILTIEETLRGPDISLNRIKVLNQSDTSGVVKFVKPFVAPAAGLEGLRAYDGSFTTTKVLHDFQVGSVTKRTGDPIEILNDASFSNHISAPDVCANVIGSRNGPPIYLSGDVSINEGLQCSDISVSHIHPLGAATKLLVNADISASGAIYASDLSGFTFRAVDVSVNDVYGANGHIDVVADISVNGDMLVTEISMNTLGGHNNRITIHDDLSVNGDLIVGEDLSLSNLFTTSDYIQFHHVTDISIVIKKVDISVGEIYPKELGNVRYVNKVGMQKETLIINGDVSFSGRVEADWVESEFNVLARVDTLATLISNTAKYPIGTLLQVKGENTNQIDIFIKTNKESWYRLKSTNASPLFTNFTLSYEGFKLLAGDFSGDITNTNTDEANYFYYPRQSDVPDVSVGLQNYEERGGFGDYDEVVFYVKKIKEEVNSVYLFDISASDQESDDILLSLIGDKTISDFSYLNGAGWGLSLPDNSEDETDISRIHIKVPINNGFDLSFILRADDKISTFNDKIITIKKINEVPVWKHMVLEASNYQYIHDEGYDIDSDASFNTEEWYSLYDPTYLQYGPYTGNPLILPIDYSKNIPSIINSNITDDVSHTFNVRYYNPAKFNGDTSYYILDLSSLDPEGFDVCYEIQTANNVYQTHDWSWNLDGSKVYIKVPGEDKSNSEDLDFSFEIISHDNNVEDVSGFVPTDYYSFNGEDVSKRIVNFHKEIPLIELLNVTVVPTTDAEINNLTNYYNNNTNITNNFINKIYSTTLNSLTIYLNNPQITSNFDISYTIKYNFNKTLGYDLEYTDVITNQSNVTNIIDYTTSGSDSDVTLYFSVYGNNTYDNNVNENFQLGININSISRTLNIKLQHYIYIESAKLKYNNDYVTSENQDIVLGDNNTKIDLDNILINWNTNTSLIYTGEVVFKDFIPDIIIPIQNLTSSQSDNTITASENINNFLANHTYNGQIITSFPKHEITIPFFNTNKIGDVDNNSPTDYQPTNITSGNFLSVIPPHNNPKYLSQIFTTTSHNTLGSLENWTSQNSIGGNLAAEWRGYKVAPGASAQIYIRDIVGSNGANNVWIWHTKKSQDGGAGGYGHHDPGGTFSKDRVASGGGGAGGVRGAIQSSWNGQRKSRVNKIEFTTADAIKIYYEDNTPTETVLPEYSGAAGNGGNGSRDNGGNGGVSSWSGGGGASGTAYAENSLESSDQQPGGGGGGGQAATNTTVNGPNNEELSISLGKGGNGGTGAWGTHIHGNSHGRGASGAYGHQYGAWGTYNRYVIIERIIHNTTSY